MKSVETLYSIQCEALASLERWRPDQEYRGGVSAPFHFFLSLKLTVEQRRDKGGQGKHSIKIPFCTLYTHTVTTPTRRQKNRKKRNHYTIQHT